MAEIIQMKKDPTACALCDKKVPNARKREKILKTWKEYTFKGVLIVWLCPKCKERYDQTQEIFDEAQGQLRTMTEIMIARGGGLPTIQLPGGN